MENIRENKYCELAIAVIKPALLAFIIYTVIQFFQTISVSTTYILAGIILTWRIWAFLFRLAWLLVQVAVFFVVIYLLIV